MARRTRRAALFVALFTLLFAAIPLGASADSTSGVAYLATTQDAFGGWDGDPAVNGEFTTSEAILAIGEAAQTGGAWSTTAAHGAVGAVQNGGQSPLDFMDTAAETPPAPGITPGKAAKWILNVALPLGLDPAAFDPAGDGTPVDLVALMGAAGADGSFGTGANFNGAAYAALASFLLNGSVPTQTVTYLQDAQTAGGWAFNGDASGATPPDNDTTSLVIEALIAAGVPGDDPVIVRAFGFLVSQAAGGDGYDNAAGNWIAFGGASPESTSRAMIMIAAAGFDASTSCWRDTAAPELEGTAYFAPDAALLDLQNTDGSWGVGFFNSFTTAQAVQGLEVGTWHPIVTAAAQTCAVPDPVPTPAPALVVQPTFTG